MKDIDYLLNLKHNNNKRGIHISPRRLTRMSAMNNQYQIIKRVGKQCLIRFTDTGYERLAYGSEIRQGTIRDPLAKSCCGIACLGIKSFEYRKTDKEYYLKMYKRWFDIIQRCYDPNHHAYYFYGAKGVRVCDRWLCFSNFYEDLPTIEGYDHDRILSGELELDKDQKQGNIPKDKQIYSVETCVFITRFENVKLVSGQHPEIIKNLELAPNRIKSKQNKLLFE